MIGCSALGISPKGNVLRRYSSKLLMSSRPFSVAAPSMTSVRYSRTMSSVGLP